MNLKLLLCAFAATFAKRARYSGIILSTMLLLCFASARAEVLPPGIYTFQDSAGNTWDGGFTRWYSDPHIYEYSYNNGPDQQFIWNGSTLQESYTLTYAFNDLNTLALGANAGTFAIVSSGNGYTIQDQASGLYVTSPFAQALPNVMGFSSTPTVWTATLVGGAASASGTMTTNDTDPSIIYSRGASPIQDWYYFQGGNWNVDYEGDEHSSNLVRSGGVITGAGAVVNFNGTGITWIGKKGPNIGWASVSIDGRPLSNSSFDFYNPSEIDQNPNVVVSGLPASSHVLSISLMDQTDGSDYWQTIDAFQINGSALTPFQAQEAGYNNYGVLSFYPSFAAWGSGAALDGSDLSGGHFWSNQAGDSISWSFTGSLIEVFGRPDYENGYMDIYIDNGYVATVNGHWGEIDDDALTAYMLFAQKLTAGQHTIKVVVDGTHDATARDSFVQIDEFSPFPKTNAPHRMRQ